MILAVTLVAGIGVAWLAYAGWLSYAHSVSFQQALLLVPIAVLGRLDARALRGKAQTTRVIYVVSHQSRLDPALMISLLPDDTLHILDSQSARSAWLEPWRAVGRTIAFNPEHLFVSRRLVRVLRGGGRLCVYMPADVAPDSREFRLYRAVARIALRAEAKTMPINIWQTAGVLPKLTVHALAPATIEELVAQNGGGITNSGALYERVTETHVEPERRAA